MAKKILVETSARHIHVCESTLKTLFGEGATLTNKKDLYLALVKCYAAYDNIDESFEGITASKLIYDEASYQYNKTVEETNMDVLATADVVCSVRTFCGIDDIINFVISLFR